MKAFLGIILIGVLASGCASSPKLDYSAFRETNPISILVVPVVNRSVDADAPDYFLTTVSKPLAERGYYVFPVHTVKRVMEDDGLADADLVHNANPVRLGELFGADSILYITIEQWDAQYIVVSTTVTVVFSYRLVDAHSGQTIWASAQSMKYSSASGSSGNLLADVVVGAVSAALTRAKPNYIPLAREANANAVYHKSMGIPYGPFSPKYGSDSDRYGVSTNAQAE